MASVMLDSFDPSYIHIQSTRQPTFSMIVFLNFRLFWQAEATVYHNAQYRVWCLRQRSQT